VNATTQNSVIVVVFEKSSKFLKEKAAGKENKTSQRTFKNLSPVLPTEAFRHQQMAYITK